MYQSQELIDVATLKPHRAVIFPLDKEYGPKELLEEMTVKLYHAHKQPTGFQLIEFPSAGSGAPEETRVASFSIPGEDLRHWFVNSFDRNFNWALLTKLDRGRDGIRPVSELMLVDVQASRIRGRWRITGPWADRQVLATFSANGQYYALAMPRRLEIRRTASNQVLRSYALPEAVSAMAFSPDESRLATGMINGTVLLWDDLPR